MRAYDMANQSVLTDKTSVMIDWVCSLRLAADDRYQECQQCVNCRTFRALDCELATTDHSSCWDDSDDVHFARLSKIELRSWQCCALRL